MERVIIQWLFMKSNIARGNWTSPVLILLPYGVLADSQQDRKMHIYKHIHKRIFLIHINQHFTF